jgi:hypothetical protein
MQGGSALISTLLMQIKNTIMLGLQYSLISIGFTLFFGMLNVVVFCNGGFYILAPSSEQPFSASWFLSPEVLPEGRPSSSVRSPSSSSSPR